MLVHIVLECMDQRHNLLFTCWNRFMSPLTWIIQVHKRTHCREIVILFEIWENVCTLLRLLLEYWYIYSVCLTFIRYICSVYILYITDSHKQINIPAVRGTVWRSLLIFIQRGLYSDAPVTYSAVKRLFQFFEHTSFLLKYSLNVYIFEFIQH